MAHDTDPALQVTEIWPLDFDALRKGTWIEPDVIERAGEGRVAFGTDPYRWRVVSLMQEIRERCGIQCRDDHGRIRLMTDDEALPYLKRQATSHLKAAARNMQRTLDIDRSKLTTDAKRAELDHAVSVAGAFRAAAMAEARKLNSWRALRADNDSEGHGSAALGAERKG